MLSSSLRHCSHPASQSPRTSSQMGPTQASQRSLRGRVTFLREKATHKCKPEIAMRTFVQIQKSEERIQENSHAKPNTETICSLYGACSEFRVSAGFRQLASAEGSAH